MTQKPISWYDEMSVIHRATAYLETYLNWRIYQRYGTETIAIGWGVDEKDYATLSPLNLSGIKAYIVQQHELSGIPDMQPPLEEGLPPFVEPFETYRGVKIYHNDENDTYWFSYNAVDYTNLVSISDARAKIDELIQLAPEQQPIPPTNLEVPAAWGWLGTLLTFIGDKINDLKNSISGIGSAIISGLTGWLSSLSDNLKQPIEDSTKNALTEALKATSEHSPDPEVKAQLEALVQQMQDRQKEIIDTIKHSQIDPEGAPAASNQLIVQLIGSQLAIKTAALLIDVLHPLKSLGVLQAISPMVDSLFSGVTIPELIHIPIDASIIPALKKYVNSIYTPNLPSYSDLQNMRTKEVIEQDEFTKNLGYQGFNAYWADKLWDAHFSPPSLNDILTAWRRGIIDESRVDQLMTIVDLDPRFKEIFDTRKYVDPPLNMTRFLFETGNIDADQVKEYVKLQGYRPEHVDAITEYITEFQARIWRRRYITSLASGYEKGVFTRDQLSQAVIEAEYTPQVADYIIKNADTRKAIAQSKTTVEEAKLLNVGDIKKAYINGLITTDLLRTDLQVRGYQSNDVELMIKLLDQEKVVTAAGGSKVALSIPELLNAWRYGEITEEKVNIELQLRGLDLSETQILINTKKKQWGIGVS